MTKASKRPPPSIQESRAALVVAGWHVIYLGLNNSCDGLVGGSVAGGPRVEERSPERAEGSHGNLPEFAGRR